MCIALSSCGSSEKKETYLGNIEELEPSKNEIEGAEQEAEKAEENTTDSPNSTEKNAKPATTKTKFDAEAVKSQIDIEEYQWESLSTYQHVALVLKNNSEYTLHPTVNMVYRAEDGTMVGADKVDERAFGPGAETVLLFQNGEAFDSYSYELSVEKDTRYKSIVDSLSYEVSTTDKKAIVSVTNNAEVPAKFAKCTILFMMDDEVVLTNAVYFTDSKFELKPGVTEIKEISSFFNSFDSVKVYFSARA